ncbi:MAG: transporter [Pontiella sp.]
MKCWVKWVAVVFIFVSASLGATGCISCGDVCACVAVCECNHEPRSPTGVMGDHVHHPGSWMVSYRYMFMNMDGMDRDVSGYEMRPVRMDMQMHTVGAMYTPFDNLTVGLMLPYLIQDMEMEMGMMDMPMEMNSEGFGDLKLTGTYRIWSSPIHQLLANLSVSLPTGSIEEEDASGARLPYSMQLGSGSYGILPGITYTGLVKGWGWGAQANGTFCLNENDHEYTQGNRYSLSVWGLRDLCAASAVSLRLKGSRVENIKGADPALNAMMTPLADPNLRAGTQLNLLAGMDYRKGPVRLSLEGGVPVVQEVDGPQLETRWMVMGGLQLSF